MPSIHYTAKVLADGHLPLPDQFPVAAGDLLEVTVATVATVDALGSDASAEERAGYLLERWAGVGRGSGRGVAEHHDDELYGK